MEETRAIKRGIAATYLRLAVYLLISLFYPPYLLSKVGVNDNGLYFFASSIASFLLLLSFGIENAYVRFMTRASGKDDLAKTNGTFLILFALSALLMASLTVLLGLLTMYSVISVEGDAYTAGALILILGISGSVDFFFSLFAWQHYHRRHFAFNQLVLLLTHVLGIGLSVLSLALGQGIIMTAFSVSIGVLAMDMTFLVSSLIKDRLPLRLPNREYLLSKGKDIYRFSFYIFIAVIVSTLYSNAGRVILGFIYDAGLAVTILGYGLQFYSYGVLISKAIGNSFSPALNALAALDNSAEIGALWKKGSLAQSLVLLLVAGGFIACGHPFICLWLGDSLSPNQVSDVYILGFSFLLLFLPSLSTSLSTEVERAYGKHRFDALFSLGMALLGVAISILLVYLLPDYLRVYGVLFGFALPIVLTSAVRLAYSYRVLKLPVGQYLRECILPTLFMCLGIVAPLVMYFGGYLKDLPSWADFLIAGFAFVMFYLGGLSYLYHGRIASFFHRKKGS